MQLQAMFLNVMPHEFAAQNMIIVSSSRSELYHSAAGHQPPQSVSIRLSCVSSFHFLCKPSVKFLISSQMNGSFCIRYFPVYQFCPPAVLYSSCSDHCHFFDCLFCHLFLLSQEVWVCFFVFIIVISNIGLLSHFGQVSLSRDLVSVHVSSIITRKMHTNTIFRVILLAVLVTNLIFGYPRYVPS